jgi:hypothetical protein
VAEPCHRAPPVTGTEPAQPRVGTPARLPPPSRTEFVPHLEPLAFVDLLVAQVLLAAERPVDRHGVRSSVVARRRRADPDSAHGTADVPVVRYRLVPFGAV